MKWRVYKFLYILDFFLKLIVFAMLDHSYQGLVSTVFLEDLYCVVFCWCVWQQGPPCSSRWLTTQVHFSLTDTWFVMTYWHGKTAYLGLISYCLSITQQVRYIRPNFIWRWTCWNRYGLDYPTWLFYHRGPVYQIGGHNLQERLVDRCLI